MGQVAPSLLPSPPLRCVCLCVYAQMSAPPVCVPHSGWSQRDRTDTRKNTVQGQGRQSGQNRLASVVPSPGGEAYTLGEGLCPRWFCEVIGSSLLLMNRGEFSKGREGPAGERSMLVSDDSDSGACIQDKRRCPVQQPPATCGCRALEVGLVQTEMFCEPNPHTGFQRLTDDTTYK